MSVGESRCTGTHVAVDEIVAGRAVLARVGRALIDVR